MLIFNHVKMEDFFAKMPMVEMVEQFLQAVQRAPRGPLPRGPTIRN